MVISFLRQVIFQFVLCNNRGIIERRLNEEPVIIEYTTAAGEAFGYKDQSSAMLPVTNGAAKPVPFIRT